MEEWRTNNFEEPRIISSLPPLVQGCRGKLSMTEGMLSEGSADHEDDGHDLLDISDVLEEYEASSGIEQDSLDEEEGEEGPMIIDATGDDDYKSTTPYIAELELHEGEPSYALAVNPKDTSTLASAGGNDRAVIFRLSGTDSLQVEIITELLGHTDTVEQVEFSADGELLATGSLDGDVRIWKVEDWSLVHVLEGPSEITWLDWHPKGAIIAAGSSDGMVWMWNAANGRCMQVFSGNSTTSTCGSFTADGKTLVTAGDGVVFVWNPKERNAAITYGGHASANFPLESAVSLACHPSLPVATIGFANGSIAVIHLQHHQVLAVLSTGENAVEHVGYMRKNPIMVTTGLQGTIQIWDSKNHRSRAVLEAPEIDGITVCTWLSKEGRIAVGCLNGSIAVWDIRSNEKIISYPIGLRDDAVFGLSEVPERNLLLASFDDGKVRIYQLP